jgi:hypothetical protein
MAYIGQLRHRRATAITVLAVTVLAVQSSATHAEGFRIETKIYFGDEKKPQSETTTLFLDGVVYDFLAAPAQTAVFRKPTGDKPGQFTLLDPQARVQTKLSTDQLMGAMEKLRSWAAEQKDPFLQFAAAPQFEESFESEGSRLVLAHHLETYTVATSPAEDREALAEYREFLDWYTRLNALLSADHFPPEPRLRLNESLARHQVVPVKVELTRTGVSDPLRAEHKFIWRLSRADLERIDGVRASLASYREVSNSEFLNTTRAEAKSH